jgi:hypothetical protein
MERQLLANVGGLLNSRNAQNRQSLGRSAARLVRPGYTGSHCPQSKSLIAGPVCGQAGRNHETGACVHETGARRFVAYRVPGTLKLVDDDATRKKFTVPTSWPGLRHD